MNTSDTIKDLCGSVNPRPKESEKTMEEYEYCKAGTHEEWSAIVDAIFRGDCEIKRSVVKPEGTRGLAVSVVWDRATHIENGREYRWKKPAQDVLLTDVEDIARGLLAGVVEWTRSDIDCFWIVPCNGTENDIERHLKSGSFRIKPGHTLPPKKTKKLVDRTAEELTPLIGYIARKKRDGLYFMITSNQVFDQENMEIAPLGSEDWQPMRKEIEVKG